jgi:hypothetical protein
MSASPADSDYALDGVAGLSPSRSRRVEVRGLAQPLTVATVTWG